MRKKVGLLLIMTFVIFVGCSKDNDNEAIDSNDIVSDTSGTYPLTGLKADDGADQRIVSVMVNNHPSARPQSGLSKADIVFEVLAEGDITRFLAMFQSEHPDVVGPVRSAREYYVDLAEGYDSLYVYHGAANFINDLIDDRGTEKLNGALFDDDGHLFKRESFRKAPHNSYLQFNAVYESAQEKGYDTTSSYEELPFLDEDEDVDGESAHEIEVNYSSNPVELVRFQYNQGSERYERFNGNDQTVELNSEEPVEVSNVLIIETSHEVIDDEGRRAIDLESGGEAYLMQKGTVQQLEWENQNGRIIPVKDGQPVAFAQGKSWINVVPSNPGIEQSVNIISE